LIGQTIVHPEAIDLGFAVEVEDGVMVPVIRAADSKCLAEMTPQYNDLVELARKRKLPAQAQGGSIATVTNFGSFGLAWATPIPLPEQTLVLGLGAGRKMPVWNEERGEFVAVMEAEFTLSFDHRVLDGGGAGRLLNRIATLLEQPDSL
jgi:pyruvate/2-oxoglutarate dehydrogenase complex dihydrolipoamide acyltransferase (E2) component